MISQAFATDLCTIDLIQALCLLHFWKSSTDGTSYRKMGYAIRIGYELNLDRFVRPLPEEEEAARVVIDRERTWCQLLCASAFLFLPPAFSCHRVNFVLTPLRARVWLKPSGFDHALSLRLDKARMLRPEEYPSGIEWLDKTDSRLLALEDPYLACCVSLTALFCRQPSPPKAGFGEQGNHEEDWMLIVLGSRERDLEAWERDWTADTS